MKKTALLAAAMLAVTLGTACDDTNVNGNDTSRLTLLLTDAPGDFNAAVVTISEIYLQRDDTGDDEGGRVILRSDPITTDLLTLSNDVSTLVDNAEVPSGTYGQLRFVVDGAYVEVETETGVEVYSTTGYAEAPASVDGELMCPSCGTSGIKVNLDGDIDLDDTNRTLLLDFDVAQTFGHQAGNSGMWIMNPTITAAPFEDAASVEVSLGLATGISLPNIGGDAITLADFSAELKDVNGNAETQGEIVAFTDTDGDGTYTADFSDVLPGQYNVYVRGPDGLTFTTTNVLPVAINVGAGGDVTQTLMISSAAVL
jgi:Domain of unknown function (DUF4382)